MAIFHKNDTFGQNASKPEQIKDSSAYPLPSLVKIGNLSSMCNSKAAGRIRDAKLAHLY